jgi:hypothetical protein
MSCTQLTGSVRTGKQNEATAAASVAYAHTTPFEPMYADQNKANTA